MRVFSPRGTLTKKAWLPISRHETTLFPNVLALSHWCHCCIGRRHQVFVILGTGEYTQPLPQGPYSLGITYTEYSLV